MNKVTLAGTPLAVATAAGAGSIASPARTPAWCARMRKPRHQPPGAVFPVPWTALYAGIAAALSPYPLWCAFATALSTHVCRPNR